jgi:ABC-type sulfate transport system permease component
VPELPHTPLLMILALFLLPLVAGLFAKTEESKVNNPIQIAKDKSITPNIILSITSCQFTASVSKILCLLIVCKELFSSMLCR